MSATKVPDVGLPDLPPIVRKEWSAGDGEVLTHEWPTGTVEEIESKYQELVALGNAGLNIAQLSYAAQNGRTSLVARFGRSGEPVDGESDDVTVVEELYAVDVIKDICEAPYFAKTVDSGKGLPLSDDEVAFVRLCSENRWTEEEIEAYVADNSLTGVPSLYSGWSTGMKELRYHMLHGVESYYETTFVLRRTRYGVRTSAMGVTFTGINTVVTAPTFKTAMDAMIASLPAGEWLKRPPQAEHLGRGRWRITEEWHYAEKWSIVYGGTWNL